MVLSIIIPQEELMKRYPIGVTRTRIRVIGVNVDRGEGNLVRVGEEFELSEFELTEYK